MADVGRQGFLEVTTREVLGYWVAEVRLGGRMLTVKIVAGGEGRPILCPSRPT